MKNHGRVVLGWLCWTPWCDIVLSLGIGNGNWEKAKGEREESRGENTLEYS